MSTIDSKEIVDELIANNGVYEDDSPVQSIVEYTNSWGKIAYGLNYSDYDYYFATEFVLNPKTIFTRKES